MLPITLQGGKHKQHKRLTTEGLIIKQHAGVSKLLAKAKRGFSPYQNTKYIFKQIMGPLQATIATSLIYFDNNDEPPSGLTKGNMERVVANPLLLDETLNRFYPCLEVKVFFRLREMVLEPVISDSSSHPLVIVSPREPLGLPTPHNISFKSFRNFLPLKQYRKKPLLVVYSLNVI